MPLSSATKYGQGINGATTPPPLVPAPTRKSRLIKVNGTCTTAVGIACLKFLQSVSHWPCGDLKLRSGNGGRNAVSCDTVSWRVGPSGKALVYYNGVLILPEVADELFRMLCQSEDYTYYLPGLPVDPVPLGKRWMGPGVEVEVTDEGRSEPEPTRDGVSGGERLTIFAERLFNLRVTAAEGVVQLINRIAGNRYFNLCKNGPCAVDFTRAVYVSSSADRRRMAKDGVATYSKPFGTIIIDPPWPYREVESDDEEVSKSLGGYSIDKYQPLDIDDLAKLPIMELADYVLLWTTAAFWADGRCHYVIRKWGLASPTTFFWIKGKVTGDVTDLHITPNYKVGYWFRGTVEPYVICKDPDAPSIRTNYVGLMGESVSHSRKPESLHRLCEEKFPGPYLEVFARRPVESTRNNWNYFGNEAPGDGRDVRETIENVRRRWIG